jgi:hypothetical protein
LLVLTTPAAAVVPQETVCYNGSTCPGRHCGETVTGRWLGVLQVVRACAQDYAALILSHPSSVQEQATRPPSRPPARSPTPHACRTAQAHAHKHMRAVICTHAHARTRAYAQAQARAHTCTRTHIHPLTYACTRTRKHALQHAHTRTHPRSLARTCAHTLARTRARSTHTNRMLAHEQARARARSQAHTHPDCTAALVTSLGALPARRACA